MILRSLILGAALLAAPGFAAAQSVQDSVIAQLRQQGFERIELSRTWLGRVRVVAQNGNLRRELVFNPSTGEILRDIWVDVGDAGGGAYVPQFQDPGDGDAGNRGGGAPAGQGGGPPPGQGGGADDGDDGDDEEGAGDGDDGDDDDDDEEEEDDDRDERGGKGGQDDDDEDDDD